MSLPKGKCWVICGPPKTGKSRFASTFPRPFYIDIDWGAEELAASNGMLRKTPSETGEFERVLTSLEKLSSTFETVVVDSVNTLSLMIENELCERKGISSVADLKYGVGWDTVGRTLMKYLQTLKKWTLEGKDVVLILHSKITEDRKTFLITENVATWIRGIAHSIGFTSKIRRQGKTHFQIDFAGDELTDAGSRDPILNQLKKVENSYQALEAAYDELTGKIESPKTETPKVETPKKKNLSDEEAWEVAKSWGMSKGINVNEMEKQHGWRKSLEMLRKALKDGVYLSKLKRLSPNF
jgi:hypothetical protein